MNISIETLCANDICNVVSLIAESFIKNEPLTKYTEIEYDVFYKFCENVIVNSFKDNLCLVARNIEGMIVGCLVAENISTTNAPIMLEMQAIVDLLEGLFQYYTDEIKLEKTLHLYMVATKIGYEGNNICFTMIQALIKEGIEQKYKYIITELTSKGTQHICINKLNFKPLYELHYKNLEPFKDLDGKCILGIKKISDI
jgi:hypothetical protein